VKLLFDENLSPRLVDALKDVYPESQHVSGVELGGAEDAAVWQYAKRYGFAIVSKDSDFAERSVLESGPPKVIWIRLGNCSTSEIDAQLRSAHEIVRAFIEEDEETCLLLGRG
jgi:predicted nuclease of predicted toxin-antitoxin system